jgi:hypothetical protein
MNRYPDANIRPVGRADGHEVHPYSSTKFSERHFGMRNRKVMKDKKIIFYQEFMNSRIYDQDYELSINSDAQQFAINYMEIHV